MNDTVTVRRALLSVFDKTGLADLARALVEHGVEIVSTGSTAQAIRQTGVQVTDVADVTGFPEILDGRVKTLHPHIHSGILADRSKDSHRAALDERGIAPVDLVVCNLYPFQQTVARPEVTDAEAIEMIDIGGPAMVRAAAKNHAHVGVVVDPLEYGTVIDELTRQGGLRAVTRRRLAAAAFRHTACYDADVVRWLERDTPFPAGLVTAFDKVGDLRYGENPHQRAAFYADRSRRWGLAAAQQLSGKELSYNNMLDTDAAWALATEFDEPCVAIIKHTNPAGVAVADTLTEAYPAALAGDPVSAFGGIVAANREVDAEAARQIVEVFTEVVVAPGFSDEALDVLRQKRNLRILQITDDGRAARPLALRSIAGGLLVQDADTAPADHTSWTVATAVQPDEATMAELRFAWQVCKHAKSNAIVLSRERASVGVGAGQMSRVDSVRIAVDKSGGRHAGAVLASDAFFPFRDAIDVAADAGVVAIIQPGGSVRDEEVVAACEERDVPMVLTGRRHFRH